MTEADRSLRRFALEGRGEDFAAFVGLAAPSLGRFLSRVLGDGDRALLDELAQRTCIAAARRAGTYRGPSPVAWLLGIAFREIRSHRREECRRIGPEFL